MHKTNTSLRPDFAMRCHKFEPSRIFKKLRLKAASQFGNVQYTVCHIVLLYILLQVLWCSCVSEKQLYLAVWPQKRFLWHHMHSSMTHARRKGYSVTVCLCRGLFVCVFAWSDCFAAEWGLLLSLFSSGDKYHQRSPGEQPGNGCRGPGARVRDPEDHRAVLPSARLQRRRPPHQRPGRGAHECKRQRGHMYLSWFISSL